MKKDPEQNLQLTKNFNTKEFACHDGSPVPLRYIENVRTLAKNLQALRDHFNEPILINSGFRTGKYNKSIGGANNSFHLRAMAADIRIKGVKPVTLYMAIHNLMALGKMKRGGLILYPTFVHYDIRSKPFDQVK